MKKEKKVKTVKKSRVEKTRNAGTWSEARYFQQIRSFMRKAFMYFKPIQIVLENASRPYTGTNKRIKKEYLCDGCGKYYVRTSVSVNHKIPTGSLNSYDDIVPFIKRLTEEDITLYNVLCSSCHLKETLQQKEERDELRRTTKI